ncbi:hypothetical protein BCR61_01745 [Xanthomonas oryzae pv. oryzae]|nr:hypothetical protein BCR61_01745 [Xanthomonas oryzae pv. oryzae]UWZ67573.1 hypothetical protein BHL62_01190 [Xanthomonas oryzae pv. oryzae]
MLKDRANQEGKSAIHLARIYAERKRNFVGQHFGARGYFVAPAKFTKHTKPTDVGVCSSLAMTLRALWPA